MFANKDNVTSPFPVRTHFIFVAWLYWLEPLGQCLTEVVRVNIPIPFLIFRESFQSFTTKCGFSCTFFRYPSPGWGSSPLYLVWWGFLTGIDFKFIKWFFCGYWGFFFRWLIWWITSLEFLTWSWCIVLLLYCNVLLDFGRGRLKFCLEFLCLWSWGRDSVMFSCKVSAFGIRVMLAL